MKRKLWIALTVVLMVLCLSLVGLLVWFRYTEIWKYCADFEPYENEFVLVRDHVKEYMNGKSGVLSVSFREPHKYDLYDDKAGSYLECPENVRNALKIISQQAFAYKDSQFEYIYCDADEVGFEIISGPYRLVYSPEKEPTVRTNSDSDIVLCRKIKDGWYHVTVWSR